MSKIPSKFLLHFIQNRFLNTISTPKLPPPPSSAIEFLKNSCGLDSETCSFGNRKLRIDEKNSQKFEYVLEFLKSHGFENSHIVKLIVKRPLVLVSRVDKNLKPKFEFLQEIGFVGPLLPKVIISNTTILFRSLDSKLKPTFCFLKDLFESDENAATAAILRSSWLLTSNLKGRMKSNIDFLIREGIPFKNIAKLIVRHPRVIMLKINRMICAVKMTKELGIQPTASIFVDALRVRLSLSDSTWKKKLEVFKNLGWSENQVFAAFKKYPFYFFCSEKKIRDVTDFCFNTAKLDPETVITHPKLFNLALDTRFRPRYRVIEVLMMKNLIEKKKKIYRFLLEEEKRFLKYSVFKHLGKIPDLLDMYRGITAVETRSGL